jgi:hypothetical protein
VKIQTCRLNLLHANDLLPGTVDYLSPTEVGGKSTTGPMPQEKKDKISKSKTGVKLGPMPQERKDKISKLMTGRKLGPMPQERRTRRASQRRA